VTVAERWYRNGVIYNFDVRAFQDSNGDGVGDLHGLISRIDYLGRLGVTTLWLSPVHPSPWRDGGYDVTDHYDFQPDLNIANPDVREELAKIVSFWDRLGVSGFRIDAAPFVIERTEPGGGPDKRDYSVLTELRERTSWRRGDAAFLAEANVPNDDLIRFFGNADGAANRLQMLFAFRLNEALMLSLARQHSEAVVEALATLPRLPRHGQWATFLRNHDEVDLSQLLESEREEVLRWLQHRGRAGPGPPGDQRRPYSYERVNVTDQRRHPDSLLVWSERMLHTRHECGEIGVGDHRVTRVEPVEVFSDREYPDLDLRDLELNGLGYRWIRLRRTHLRY
jgi:glycosidase